MIRLGLSIRTCAASCAAGVEACAARLPSASRSVFTQPISRPTLSMEGRIVLVTGSTQGLGAGIVRTLADLGAEGVVITGRDTDKAAELVAEVKTAGCTPLVVSADLAVEADCRRIVAEADAKFGRLDGVVNAAGCTFRGGLFNSDAKLWDYMFNVNARAPFFIMQEAAKIMMREGNGGSIVNISSKSAYGGQPFITTYNASKAALDCLTKNAAHTLKAEGIRVNAVNLGWCLTDQEQVIQLEEKGEGWQEKAEAGMATGRMLRPEDCAAMTAFLLSDASVMVTGGQHNIFPEEPVPGCCD